MEGRTRELAVLLLLLAAAVALPVTLEGQAVELAQESGAWGDLYEMSLETKASAKQTASEDLGEAKQRDIRDPPKVRNVYGQQVQDMQKQKRKYAELKNERDQYDRLQYYGKSNDLAQKVYQSIAANQAMAGLRVPNKATEAIVSSLNTDLMNAIREKNKAEYTGFKKFAYHKQKANTNGIIPDKSTGEFGKLYHKSMQLKSDEDIARKLTSEAKAPGLPKKVLKRLYTKKELKKAKGVEDIYWAYSKNPKDMNSKHSRAFGVAKKKVETKLRLEELLKDAANSYKDAKSVNPELKYADTVKGTRLQGILNLYAMTAKEKEDMVASLERTGRTMGTKEQTLEKAKEKYLQRFTQDARIVSKQDFAKSENVGRQVKATVKDPTDVPNKVVKKMAAELYQKKFHPDLDKVMRKLRKANKDSRLLFDKEEARALRRAPKKKDLKKLVKERVLGAKQLAIDTAVANKKLKKEAAHPHKTGKNKYKFASNKRLTRLPNWKKIKKEADEAQKRKLVALAWQAEAKDAKALAKTGSRLDLKLMRHDQKAGIHGLPVPDKKERKVMSDIQDYYNIVRKTEGSDRLKDLKKGIQVRAAKELALWQKMKKAVVKGAISGPSRTGTQALEKLPKNGKSPLLQGDLAKVSFSGTTTRAAVPLNKDSLPVTGTSKASQAERRAQKIGPGKKAAEKRPSGHYTPTSKKDQKAADSLNGVDDLVKRADKVAKQTEVAVANSGSKTAKVAAKQADKMSKAVKAPQSTQAAMVASKPTL